MSYTGPYVLEEYHTWPGQFGPSRYYFDYQSSYRTTWPSERRPLPYYRYGSFYDGKQHWGGGNEAWSDCSQIGTTEHLEGRLHADSYGLVPKALNRARSKFINSLQNNQSASIGAALGEWKQSFDMIANRLKDLDTAWKAVRFRNLGTAQALMGVPPKGWRQQSKKPADLWLEWHFGWSPMLSDIHGAMEALSSQLPQAMHVKVASRATYHQDLVATVDNGFSRKRIKGQFNAVAGIEGWAKLVNPSVGLLSQLGLINPVSVAWELVPWSFLVDHVVGIGDFIESFTDTIGWDLYDISVADYRYVKDGYFDTAAWTGWQGNYTYGEIYPACTAYRMRRYQTWNNLPEYCLHLTNPFRDISVKRAATYCALLLQSLGK